MSSEQQNQYFILEQPTAPQYGEECQMHSTNHYADVDLHLDTNVESLADIERSDVVCKPTRPRLNNRYSDIDLAAQVEPDGDSQQVLADSSGSKRMTPEPSTSTDNTRYVGESKCEGVVTQHEQSVSLNIISCLESLEGQLHVMNNSDFRTLNTIVANSVLLRYKNTKKPFLN